jgi:GTP-binding protein YchF
MKVATFGFSQSGKSSLFAACTGAESNPANAGHEQQAMVAVPDKRLTKLAEIFKPKKITKAQIEFSDLPGVSFDDPRGRDEFRTLLPTLRLADVLLCVVRDFQNPSVPAYRNRVDAQKDLTELWDELVLCDLQLVADRIDRLNQALKKPTKDHDQQKRELALLDRCLQALENTQPLTAAIERDEDRKTLAGFQFLTQKPQVVAFNVTEDRANQTDCKKPDFAAAALNVYADGEAQVALLDPEDQNAFLEDMGIEVPVRDRLIRHCYDALGLITMLTAGEQEVRAWPLKTGSSAVEAAGKIHSDLARGFIRAETVAYNDLIAAGSMKIAKANGQVRQEGKTYIVNDGDVITIKFNV